MADRFYKFLTRHQKNPVGKSAAQKIGAIASQVMDTPKVNLPAWNSLLILSCAGLVTATIAARAFAFDMLLTYVIMAAMVALGLWLSKITHGKVPALIVVITLGTLITSPVVPFDEWLVVTSTSVDFLSVITLMLGIAGLRIGKDLPMLKQIGWKIIPVGFVVISATFPASTIVAEVVLRIID